MFQPKYDPNYDPVEHLDRLKVKLVRMPLTRHSALWLPSRKTVVVDKALPNAHFRPVLAHECIHAENNDPGGHNSKFEDRANLHSAIILTNPTEWDFLTAATDDYDRICLEIGITREQFMAYAENVNVQSMPPARTKPHHSPHVFRASQLVLH